MVGRTVQAYIRAGVAGMHLEDQVVSKRCGHLKGKQLVDISEFTSRIKAARMAREQSHGDIVLIARTDALASHGYDEAVKRLKAAVQEGADVAFLEGVNSKAEAERFCNDMGGVPCLYNNVPGGVSPDFSVNEAKQIGYRIAIYPCLAFEQVYPVVRNALRQLKETGRVDAPEANGHRYSPRELFEVCGLKETMAFDVEAGGTAYSEGA
jgi:2-methylisocitrate lyase-like PEP mutase family enzyme